MLYFGHAHSKGLDEICSDLPPVLTSTVSLTTMAFPFIFLLFVMVKCMLFFKSYIVLFMNVQPMNDMHFCTCD